MGLFGLRDFQNIVKRQSDRRDSRNSETSGNNKIKMVSRHMRMFQNFVRGAIVAVLLSAGAPVLFTNSAVLGASEAQAAVVSRIVVKGNTRVDADSVRNYVTIKPGKSYTAFDVDESIRALFGTGLFADVNISRQSSSLIVIVVENPVINRVSFEGNKKVKDEVLKGAVRSQPRSVLTQARVQADVQKVLEIYRRSGRFQASVEPKIIELGKNRVNLVFEISEGGKTGVTRISFIGNKAFSDRRLRQVIKTRESGLLSFLRSGDTYDPDRLNADQELMRRYYYKKGYADFRIVSAVADLDRERNVFFVTFTVDEGEPYTFGEVDIQTSLLNVDPEQLRSFIHTSAGDTYNAEAIEKSMEDLVIAVSRWGYAFAQIRPRGSRDYENHTISITYFVDEGPRVYVERITIRGNTRTRGYVIRREFDFAEGDAFNRALLQKAERRLNELGYFKSVQILTAQGSAPDKVVITVVITEEATGAISFGAGYSLTEGVVGDITLTEKNFLGRGQYLKIKVGGGSKKREYDFAFTEPYFLGRRIAASVNLYSREYESTAYRTYSDKSIGGSVGLGVPITEHVSVGISYSFIRQVIKNPTGAVLPTAVPIGKRTISSISYNVTYDSLDNRQNPTDGIYAQVQQTFAGVGGSVRYLRTEATAIYYHELLSDWGLIGMLSARGGVTFGIGQTLATPDSFFLGGEKIRGFESNGIGPRDTSTTNLDSVGGRFYYAVSAEATMPMPFVPADLGVTMAIFADAGSLWSPDPKAIAGSPIVANAGKLRASVGVGFGWASPMGPLRFDFAYALLKNKADKLEIFRFGGGTRF